MKGDTLLFLGAAAAGIYFLSKNNAVAANPSMQQSAPQQPNLPSWVPPPVTSTVTITTPTGDVVKTNADVNKTVALAIAAGGAASPNLINEPYNVVATKNQSQMILIGGGGKGNKETGGTASGTTIYKNKQGSVKTVTGYGATKVQTTYYPSG